MPIETEPKKTEDCAMTTPNKGDEPEKKDNKTEEGKEGETPTPAKYSLEDLFKEINFLKKENKDLRQLATTGTKESYSLLLNDIEDLKKENAEIKKEKQLSEATEFVFKYSRSESPSLPTALEKTAIFLLSKANETEETEKYSLGEKQLGYKETLKHFISSLPPVKKDLLREKVVTKNGTELSEETISKYSLDDNLEGIETVEKIKKYALDNSIKESEAFELYFQDQSILG